MKILSIDVGIKNLAYCLLHVSQTAPQAPQALQAIILDWALLKTSDANCKKAKLEDLVDDLLVALNASFGDTFECDLVLIENQPPLKNGMMKTLSVVIYTYFNMMRLQYGTVQKVQYVSAASKCKCRLGKTRAVPKTYVERKRLSIDIAKDYLRTIDPIKIEWLDKQIKQDDLCDCLNQAIYVIENAHMNA